MEITFSNVSQHASLHPRCFDNKIKIPDQEEIMQLFTIITECEEITHGGLELS
jgi:uncharacterized protein YqhQ